MTAWMNELKGEEEEEGSVIVRVSAPPPQPSPSTRHRVEPDSFYLSHANAAKPLRIKIKKRTRRIHGPPPSCFLSLPPPNTHTHISMSQFPTHIPPSPKSLFKNNSLRHMDTAEFCAFPLPSRRKAALNLSVKLRVRRDTSRTSMRRRRVVFWFGRCPGC